MEGLLKGRSKNTLDKKSHKTKYISSMKAAKIIGGIPVEKS